MRPTSYQSAWACRKCMDRSPSESDAVLAKDRPVNRPATPSVGSPSSHKPAE
jgi:hypothetical protein